MSAADLSLVVVCERALDLRVGEGEVLQRAERAPRGRQAGRHARAGEILNGEGGAGEDKEKDTRKQK